MPADISIGTSNGARAVALLNRQLSALPMLRPLMLVVKAFLREQGLNEVSALSPRCRSVAGPAQSSSSSIF